MRSSLVVRASGRYFQSRNSPGCDPSILRHNEIRGAADKAVLNNVHKKEKNPKSPPSEAPWKPLSVFLLDTIVVPQGWGQESSLLSMFG
jgi:hypothetical protein